MRRFIELIEPFDQNGNEPNSAMCTAAGFGDWVLYEEAQAEIDRLTAEIKALKSGDVYTACRHQFETNGEGGAATCIHCYSIK